MRSAVDILHEIGCSVSKTGFLEIVQKNEYECVEFLPWKQVKRITWMQRTEIAFDLWRSTKIQTLMFKTSQDAHTAYEYLAGKFVEAVAESE